MKSALFALVALLVVPSIANAAPKLSAADKAWVGKCANNLVTRSEKTPKSSHIYCTCMHEQVENNEEMTQKELERAGHRCICPAANRRDGSNETVMSADKTQKPTIARIWRGRTTRVRADEYAAYLYEHGIKPLEQKALGVQQMREDRADDSKFVTISYWDNVEAMSRFAGKDPRRIHHLEHDPEFLIELPQSVQVLEITASHGNTGGSR